MLKDLDRNTREMTFNNKNFTNYKKYDPRLIGYTTSLEFLIKERKHWDLIKGYSKGNKDIKLILIKKMAIS